MVSDPERTIFALVTDFCEGGSPRVFYAALARMFEARELIGLAALDDSRRARLRPRYGQPRDRTGHESRGDDALRICTLARGRDPMNFDLTLYDDTAIEALAPKGLARRARSDLEAGRATVKQRDATSAVVEAEGQTISIDARGPKAAKCTCPASGICRHVLVAVMALNADSAAPTEGTSASQAATPTATEELCALTQDNIQAFAGADWNAAVALAAASSQSEIQGNGRNCTVEIAGYPASVAFLAGVGLKGAAFKGPKARARTVIAAAAILLRAKHGVAVDVTGEEVESGVQAYGPRTLSCRLSRADPSCEVHGATPQLQAPSRRRPECGILDNAGPTETETGRYNIASKQQWRVRPFIRRKTRAGRFGERQARASEDARFADLRADNHLVTSALETVQRPQQSAKLGYAQVRNATYLDRCGVEIRGTQHALIQDDAEAGMRRDQAQALPVARANRLLHRPGQLREIVQPRHRLCGARPDIVRVQTHASAARKRRGATSIACGVSAQLQLGVCHAVGGEQQGLHLEFQVAACAVDGAGRHWLLHRSNAKHRFHALSSAAGKQIQERQFDRAKRAWVRVDVALIRARPSAQRLHTVDRRQLCCPRVDERKRRGQVFSRHVAAWTTLAQPRSAFAIIETDDDIFRPISHRGGMSERGSKRDRRATGPQGDAHGR